MPVKIPEFSDQFLSHFWVTISILDAKDDRFSNLKSTEVLSARHGDGSWYNFRRTTTETSEQAISGIYLSLDCIRAASWMAEQEPGGTIDEIGQLIGQFSGASAVFWSRGMFSIPKSKLPRDGIVQAMTGIKTAAGGQNLILTGAVMAFDGDAYDELDWKVSGDDVSVTLGASDRIVVGDGYIVNAVSRLSRGVRQIILEEKPNIDVK